MKTLKCNIKVDRYDVCGVEAYKAWAEEFPNLAEYSQDPIEAYEYLINSIKAEIQKINKQGGNIFPLIEE